MVANLLMKTKSGDDNEDELARFAFSLSSTSSLIKCDRISLTSNSLQLRRIILRERNEIVLSSSNCTNLIFSALTTMTNLTTIPPYIHSENIAASVLMTMLGDVTSFLTRWNGDGRSTIQPAAISLPF
ncbi:hypothetical protein KIN20_024648 [Parelaphostrongylus tenuis]|uniref:Uncharacterized protein n=1 Tax=Parelaphostrongylus tenuis TaxID=148309 RepID=A0AAD5QWV5_PARTN|nr:hypothetical protein KIN20_024648 [Parelaphostrongylus tenuis]